jgi:geranylgeranyl pyrophosphate synthase
MDPDLVARLDRASSRVDRALEEFLRAGPEFVENLHDGLLYALGLGQEAGRGAPDRLARGKRIRPALCLLTCEALDGDPERAVPFAMAVELMHNFFLVHDDIEDGDVFRRGRPCVWKRYGLAHGINIGDYLLTKVFAAFISTAEGALSPTLQVALLDLLVETLERTHIGQARDLNALAKKEISVAGYMEIVENKSGYLATPMVGGAMVAEAPSETLDALREMGRCVSPIFQIVDDTIDLTEGKGRDRPGCDVREGKRSFLVAHACAKASAEEREELFRVLDLPREETTDDHVKWVRDLFDKYGAIEAGRRMCEDLMERARRAVAPTPPKLRDTLIGVFEGLLDRKR